MNTVLHNLDAINFVLDKIVSYKDINHIRVASMLWALVEGGKTSVEISKNGKFYVISFIDYEVNKDGGITLFPKN